MDDVYRAFYEDKAKGYAERDLAAISRYERALTIAELERGHAVLDVACKDAALLELLQKHHPGVTYTGIDISTRVIEKNKAKYPGVAFQTADVIAGTPFPEKSFDRIFALEILEHVPQPFMLLQEARRLLKHSGRLLVSVPNPYYYMEVINELRHFPEDDGHLFAFRDANLRGLLRLCGFEVETVIGTHLLVPKRLRGAFRNADYWIVKSVPSIFACSRIYRCRPA